jgi:hypothetical protein
VGHSTKPEPVQRRASADSQQTPITGLTAPQRAHREGRPSVWDLQQASSVREPTRFHEATLTHARVSKHPTCTCAVKAGACHLVRSNGLRRTWGWGIVGLCGSLHAQSGVGHPSLSFLPGKHNLKGRRRERDSNSRSLEPWRRRGALQRSQQGAERRVSTDTTRGTRRLTAPQCHGNTSRWTLLGPGASAREQLPRAHHGSWINTQTHTRFQTHTYLSARSLCAVCSGPMALI